MIASVPDTSNRFDRKLRGHGLSLERARLEVLQVNVGRLCNQTCRHCHVNAGPTRTELMSMEVAEAAIAWLDKVPTIHTLDITGGAPEMAPCFRRLAEAGAERGKKVIDRCNLTILTEPGYEDLADFLARHRVAVIASLPCYSAANVDKQRGDGVFERSIAGLRTLNALGYGQAEGEPGQGALRLDLVYNPIGPKLPPSQKALEAAYRQKLKADFGIVFDRLLTITNLPVGRFRSALHRSGELEGYVDLLDDNFNPCAVAGLMCRNHLSVDYRGYLYDCDFNQMTDLPIGGSPLNILETTPEEVARRRIATADHCLGCTSGAGSSCGGSLA
ncbi:MAG: arsenosugar biosynthesis radical SAM protein ArsS [Sumerlaeia bacterium]